MIKIFSKKSNVVTEDILEALASVFRNIFCADLVFNYFPFLFIYLVYWCFGEQCFRISVIQFLPPIRVRTAGLVGTAPPTWPGCPFGLGLPRLAALGMKILVKY